MRELIPLAEGVLLGGLFFAFRVGALRRLILMVICGAGATIVSGEFRLSWGYCLLDVFEVSAVSIAVAFMAGFRHRNAGVRSNRQWWAFTSLR